MPSPSQRAFYADHRHEVTMAGYSGTPLAKKLGIKPDSRWIAVDAPPAFAVPDAPDVAREGPYDVVLAFATTHETLLDHLETWRPRLDPAGGLWIAWPKKASGVPTELTEEVVRVEGLDHRLVDNKVCAIDEVWSGLRLVIRVADRPGRSRR
jgi:hypothetical protein